MAGMEGNQAFMLAAGKRLTLDTLEPRIARPVAMEGAARAVRGRVVIEAAGPGWVHALVRAGRPFDVWLRTTPGGFASVSCDCVGFQEEPAVCRHVWAALIVVQNEDL